MDKKLKNTFKQSFTPPSTQRREPFINSISYPKARFREVVWAQISFIRKRVWFVVILSIFAAFFFTQFARLPEHIVAEVSAILPFVSLCIITELYKSTAYNMEEMELSCKHNLSKITLMRLGILGTVSFILLVLLILIVEKNNYGLLRNTVYISVPYLLSSYISLLLILKFRSKEALYICAAISGTVSIFMFMTITNYRFIYHTDFTVVWGTAFIMLIGLLIYSGVRFAKSREELQWNLS